MKRKLDENDAPTVEVSSQPEAEKAQNSTTFESFNLDPRLLQSISKASYSEPTTIQARAIPLALQGKDVLAQSQTGSGKTAAYVIPILQSILHRRTARSSKDGTVSALVLVPTRELADQVQKVFITLSSQCAKEIRSINLAQRVSDAVLNAMLSDTPDVVVSTPGRVHQFLTAGKLSLDQVNHLVIDEADLVLSYGYEEDIKAIADAVPRAAQAFLMSATLTSDIDALKETLCKDPVVVRIYAQEEPMEPMTQYVVKCAEDEKFLLIFVIFKLRLVRGKTIVFVDDVDRSYRLKLYLEQFGIKSCILNSELPVNSRLHVVQEFNKGLYNILIAADDQEVLGGVHKPTKATSSDEMNGTTDDLSSDEDEAASKTPKTTTTSSKSTKPRDYGVSRGIDFQAVSCVLNFDLPHTSKSYTHRIGRTARAGQSGMALSFVIPATQYRKHIPTSTPSAKHDEATLTKILSRQSKLGRQVQDYNFDPAQIAAFRYRCNDAIRAVTRLAVREARAREIKGELVKSEKLRKHFEENPEDLKHLRHDLDSGGTRVQGHLRHVPDYLLPEAARAGKPLDVGFVGLHKKQKGPDNPKRGGKGGRRGGGGGGGFKKKMGVGRRVDPLKSFGGRK